MPPTVRTAGPDDLAALRTLRAAWTTELGTDASDPRFHDRFSSWFLRERDRRTFWIALDAARPIGMLNLLVVRRMPRPGHDDREWGYLGNLYVTPSHRRQGVGSLLVDVALAQATEHGLVRLVLHPNATSMPFWRSRGFSDAGDLLVKELS